MDGRRGSYRVRGEPDPIDLGNEPPLSVDGETHGVIDRRRISAQWFSGTILTGLCGAALMGGAVFTSLDGEAHFAALPERVESALRGAVDRLSGARKADKLPPIGENTAARHVVRLSMTSRVGSREVVRVRPFVRVSANLSLSVSDLSANIPPFNPQKLLSEGAADGGNPDEPAANAEPDAEVSFVMRELTPMVTRMKIASVMPLDDILVSVREAANWTNRNSAANLSRSRPRSPAQMAYAPADSSPDPYRGFETRIIPENITLLPKTANQTTGGNSWSERAVNVKQGRQYLDHPARTRRDDGRDQGHRRDPRPARTRQRPEGRPAAAHSVVADCRRRAPAADPRDHRQ